MEVRWDSSLQTWWQVPLPIEQSSQPSGTSKYSLAAASLLPSFHLDCLDPSLTLDIEAIPLSDCGKAERAFLVWLPLEMDSYPQSSHHFYKAPESHGEIRSEVPQ